MTAISENVLLKAQNMRDLPVLSVVRTQGLDLLKSRNATRKDFAEVLKYDQVLSAKILRLVNSSSYCLSKSIGDVETALGFLGDHTLQMLFLGSNVFSAQDSEEPFCIGDFWLHNYMVAVASSELAPLADVSPTELFSCGLLHDLGKLALWKSQPEIFREVLALKKTHSLSFFEAENELGIPGHHVVGEEVGRVWNLPFVIRKTMRFHHRNVWQMTTLEEDVRKKIAVVILANQIVHSQSLGSAWGKEESALAETMKRALKIDLAQLKDVEKTLHLERIKVEWLTRLVNFPIRPKI